MPPDPEALRRRMKLIGVTWAMIHLKQPEAEVLQGLTETSWFDHLGHLLSEEV